MIIAKGISRFGGSMIESCYRLLNPLTGKYGVGIMDGYGNFVQV